MVTGTPWSSSSCCSEGGSSSYAAPTRFSMLASSEAISQKMLANNRFPGVHQVVLPGLAGIKTPVQLARYDMRA